MCRHWPCGFLGARCGWEIAVWTDDLKAYVHVPNAARTRVVNINGKKSGRLSILCHLKADHTHDLIPDTDMIMAHPLAKAVPQVAEENKRLQWRRRTSSRGTRLTRQIIASG